MRDGIKKQLDLLDARPNFGPSNSSDVSSARKKVDEKADVVKKYTDRVHKLTLDLRKAQEALKWAKGELEKAQDVMMVAKEKAK